jgi:hypothetical protein
MNIKYEKRIVLNLIVKDGMTIMDKGTERVRDSVGF